MTEPTISCPNCQTDFPKRRLRCPKCNEIGVSKLYRYVRFCERSLDILKNKQVWFPTGESLNDPFEFAYHLAKLPVGGVPLDEESLKTANKDMRQLGVLSLTEINDSILMWSHYSDSHTGFCVEFERTDSNELGNWDHCAPVQYDQNLLLFPPLDLLDKKVVSRILTTKSQSWAYEKEWRILAKKGNQKYPLPGNITAIIFGLRMPDKNRREIAEILGDTITYLEAVMSETQYTVNIRSVSQHDLLGAA